MKTITILALALLATACDTTGYQEPVTVVGNGTEPCPKGDCPERDPNVRRDPK
jgi:hypothetical protein